MPVILPAPELPAGPRSALVIATGVYRDARLAALRSSARDAAEFAAVLGDPLIGGFAVKVLLDEAAHALRIGVEDFLATRAHEETVVVYLSCHGVLNARRRLYFAAVDTDRERLAATGLEARWLIEQLDECRARRQVVVLDCCFSGAFASTKAGAGAQDVGLENVFGLEQGRGRVVLTASRATEFSFEGEALADGSVAGSVFTAALVEGLRSGAADRDGDGLVSVSDLYAFAYEQVKATGAAQTPQRWVYGGEGEVALARSAAGISVGLAMSQEIHRSLTSGLVRVRLAGVAELGDWLQDPDPQRVLAARQALQGVVDRDSLQVAEAARRLLETSAVSGIATAEAIPASASHLPNAEIPAHPHRQPPTDGSRRRDDSTRPRSGVTADSAAHTALISQVRRMDRGRFPSRRARVRQICVALEQAWKTSKPEERVALADAVLRECVMHFNCADIATAAATLAVGETPQLAEILLAFFAQQAAPEAIIELCAMRLPEKPRAHMLQVIAQERPQLLKQLTKPDEQSVETLKLPRQDAQTPVSKKVPGWRVPRHVLTWPQPGQEMIAALHRRGFIPHTWPMVNELPDAELLASPPFAGPDRPRALLIDPTSVITRRGFSIVHAAATAVDLPMLITAGIELQDAYGPVEPSPLLQALAKPGDNKKALIIESRTNLSRALTLNLKGYGFSPIVAPNDRQGVLLAEQMRLDIVIADLAIMRQRRSGILDWVRSYPRSNGTSVIPVIAYTVPGPDIYSAKGMPRLGLCQRTFNLATNDWVLNALSALSRP